MFCGLTWGFRGTVALTIMCSVLLRSGRRDRLRHTSAAVVRLGVADV
jgi:hypothetical protein